MDQTATPVLPVPERPSPAAILQRVALPLLLFSLVLTGLLSLSLFIVLPSFTRVAVDGVPKTAEELRIARLALTSDILRVQQERVASLQPLTDSRYDALKAARAIQTSFAELRAAIRSAAAGVTTVPDAVHITAIRYDADTGAVELDGDVRNVGPRSMTLLAQFADALGLVPGFIIDRQPAYTRVEDPVAGFHSPFSLSLVFHAR